MGSEPRAGFTNLEERLGALAAHLEETVRRRGADKAAAKGVKVVELFFHNLHDLFTRGVTGEGLKNLIHRETRDTLRFYTKEVDFESLRSLPWFKRYPLTGWKLFLATAYRLSPPRRIAFAIAAFSFLLGGLQIVMASSNPPNAISGIFWWSIAVAILFLLLLMELRDKLDLKGDLEIAREIQIALVPSRPYEREGIRIFSHMRPANTVGGDYHDIIDLGNDGIGVVIGDVAGKGMPAALLMALLQGSLRTLLTANFRGPELIRMLNEYLCDNIPANSLVTLFFGELNTSTGELRYINAGHNAPFLLQHGRITQRLAPTSLVLGVLREAAFEARHIRLDAGDRILLFTDGVTEAFDPDEREYGEERLEKFLQNNADHKEEELVFGLIKEVLAFCDHRLPGDDMTLMCIRRL